MEAIANIVCAQLEKQHRTTPLKDLINEKFE